MGCEPARLQPVRPCRPWAVPPGSGAASLSPLVLPRRFAGRGRCGQPRGPRARTRAAVQPPSAPPSPLPRLPLLAAAGGRALPAALGPGSGAACVCGGGSARVATAPPPLPPGRGASPAGRAPAPASSPALPAARAPIPVVAPFCLRVRARSPHGRPHSPPFVSRAPGFLGPPARVCDRFRRAAFLLLSSLSDGGLDVGAFATSPLTFGPM